jgi:hypothetical protein
MEACAFKFLGPNPGITAPWVKQKVNGRVSCVEANRSSSADGRRWGSKAGVDAGRWSRHASVRDAAYRESAEHHMSVWVGDRRFAAPMARARVPGVPCVPGRRTRRLVCVWLECSYASCARGIPSLPCLWSPSVGRCHVSSFPCLWSRIVGRCTKKKVAIKPPAALGHR